MTLKKAIGSGILALVTAFTLPVVTAAPAAAAVHHCWGYLVDEGYDISPAMYRACEIGGQVMGEPLCRATLQVEGVAEPQARGACLLA